MPLKMRLPNIASLLGERSVKVQRWLSVLTEVERCCQASEVIKIRRTQSKGTKNLCKLYLLGKLVAVKADLEEPTKSYWLLMGN